ncbi:phosphate carrier protein, mitochondrial [Echinops telfairi]|uniref:Phosphate carrier protein, mitochondrial n=1 Tax=Echinops telfairi TaxID=9371 RepID=A0AC55D684_ECHTE|nr:phosphate carrier protein, mitochondrial [Echinops telfairi]
MDFFPPNQTEQYSCDYGSGRFFILCGIGGIISCGTTHTALVPLDLVKCRMQVDPQKYKGIFNGFSVTLKEDGVRGLAKGWAPTFIGYSMQGLCKFGFYEVFKVLYSNMLGEVCIHTGSCLALSAGVFCAIVSHPADSVVSVLNKEKGSTASQVLLRLGFKGVWKGLFARIIMIGTLTALQWFIYDSVKVYFRLPRPPPPEMPESLKKKLGLTQ